MPGQAVSGEVELERPHHPTPRSARGSGSRPSWISGPPSGKHRGLPANTVEILRLDTVGGVAPADHPYGFSRPGHPYAFSRPG